MKTNRETLRKTIEWLEAFDNEENRQALNTYVMKKLLYFCEYMIKTGRVDGINSNNYIAPYFYDMKKLINDNLQENVYYNHCFISPYTFLVIYRSELIHIQNHLDHEDFGCDYLINGVSIYDKERFYEEVESLKNKYKIQEKVLSIIENDKEDEDFEKTKKEQEVKFYPQCSKKCPYVEAYKDLIKNNFNDED